MTKQSHWIKPLRWMHIDSIPENAIGVYGFWHPRRSSKRCLYVGKAEKSLRKRLQQHWERSHNARLERWLKCCRSELEVCYIIIPSDQSHQISGLEARLINRLNPETNIQKPGS